jgi:HD superfamily phosphohydrolase
MLIRDPVHGDITLSAAEAAVLDCPQVQRLRGIRQLGTAYLVYPGALHTRFDHSLGVCALSHRILDGLARAGHSIPEEIRRSVGIAALLHDVTHIPFGHTLEDERRLFPRHDRGSRWQRLLSGELGETLERVQLLESVRALLENAPGAPRWAAQLVASTIDADLLDYLRRDAWFAGLATAYDDRVFQYFTIADGELALNLARRGMDRPDARSEVIQLLRTRYFLTERVYFHHTKVIAGAMISKAVEASLDSGELTEANLLELGDATLLQRLEERSPPTARMLARRVRQRALFKRGYVLSGRSLDASMRQDWVDRYHESRAARAEVERELAAAAGVSASDVIVYCPALTVMKEASATIVTPQGTSRLNAPQQMGLDEITALEERYAELWRFYVFVPEEQRGRIRAAAGEYFGYTGEQNLEKHGEFTGMQNV